MFPLLSASDDTTSDVLDTWPLLKRPLWSLSEAPANALQRRRDRGLAVRAERKDAVAMTTRDRRLDNPDLLEVEDAGNREVHAPRSARRAQRATNPEREAWLAEKQRILNAMNVCDALHDDEGVSKFAAMLTYHLRREPLA